MLVRRLYGTALKLGVHGAYAYDVPRIEHVSLSPKYWAESGLPGAPTSKTLSKLKAYLQKNLVGIMCGEQDWGYWWDIDIDFCQKGLLVTAVPSDDGKLLNTGNVAAGNVRIRNAGVGVFLENPGYPCFMLTGSDVSARVCPVYFGAKPDFSEAIARGVKPWYQSDTSLVVSDTTLRGGKYSVGSAKIGPYAISLKDCTFTGYANAAVRSAAGNIVVARCRFDEAKAAAYEMGEKVDQLVLSGNSYKGPSAVGGWESNDSRIIRDEKSKSVPAAIKYAFDHTPRGKPASPKIWDVTDFGAARGTFRELPKEDSTAAFQKALDTAGAAKGGTVYVPAGSYKLFGGVKVPPGVELRGSFEGAHYGNATMRGTMLWAIGGKDKPDDAPLVTLSRGSGVRGITVYYPHQGWSDLPEVEDRIRVKKYPPTVRAAAQSWIRDCTFIGSWTAIDAMTVKCDGIEIADVTGAALGTTLEIGHGTTGGTVRDLHFNLRPALQLLRLGAPGRIPQPPRQQDRGRASLRLLVARHARNSPGRREEVRLLLLLQHQRRRAARPGTRPVHRRIVPRQDVGRRVRRGAGRRDRTRGKRRGDRARRVDGRILPPGRRTLRGDGAGLSRTHSVRRGGRVVTCVEDRRCPRRIGRVQPAHIVVLLRGVRGEGRRSFRFCECVRRRPYAS